MSRKTLSPLSNCLPLFVIVLLCLLGPSLAAADPLSSENQRPLTGPDPSSQYVIYWDEIVLGIVFMIIGIIECFWGYRLIRLSMFVVGYLVFSSLAFFLILLAAGGTLTTSLTGAGVIILVWFLAGFVGSVVCFIFWHLGLAIVVMYGGFQLGLAITGFANIHSYAGRIALIVLFMAILVVLTCLEVRHVVIITTSLGGAFTFVWGIDEFAHQGFRQMISLLGPDGSEFHTTPGLWGELAVVAVVFAAGTGYEYWAHETPDPSNLFGDGTRRAQEELKHVEDEVEGTFKKFWKRSREKKDVESGGNGNPTTAPPSSPLPSQPPPPPPQNGGRPARSAWLASSKNPSSNMPLSSSSSSPSWWSLKPKTSASPATGGSSWFQGWYGKSLDKGKGREGEAPIKPWWRRLSGKISRRSDPKFSDGEMQDISEITG